MRSLNTAVVFVVGLVGAACATEKLPGEINRAPIANAGSDREVSVGERIELDGSGSVDPNDDPLSYRWRLTAPQGSATRLENDNHVVTAFVADVAGTFEVTLIATDGSLDSPPDKVVVEALGEPVNRRPVAVVGSNFEVGVGTSVALDGEQSFDPDNDTLSYRWEITDGPSAEGAQLQEATLATPIFVAGEAGDYVVTLVVSDGQLDSAPVSIGVTAVGEGNRPPIADAGRDLSIAVGTEAVLDGSNSADPEGLTLEYFWSLLDAPDGSRATLSASNVPRPTLVPDVSGVYLVQLAVRDGQMTSAPDTVSVSAEVLAPQAPGALGDVVITEFMANPDALADADGEWFELLNPGTTAWDLNGCTLSDLGIDAHIIGSSFEIAPGQSVSLARSAMPGFAPDYVYGGGFALANSGDEIILTCGGTEIAQVAYASSTAGASEALLRSRGDEVQNDDPANWCTSSSSYNGDFGTPGATNEFQDVCP